ncbi:hypothetical protein FQA39_LY17217 [Lamprigera yunnana]|nr:hypothetical protein FQA39_LY17217 [Lamprigera yunnana]
MGELQRKQMKDTVVVPTLLGYELNVHQFIIANYLVPSVSSCFLYIVHFAFDFGVAYRHFYENNPIWGGLTLFFMYLPAISCYTLTISLLELWPKLEGCGGENTKWCLMKTLQHVFFPIWSIWRHAEKIFWSIEAVRSEDQSEKEKIREKLTAPRTVELYYFLQGYLQAAPQILLQLHIIMRHTSDVEKDTVDVQVLSVILSLVQMAKTTTLFQRFKSQNAGGKSYPWFKPYKFMYDTVDGARGSNKPFIVYRCRTKNSKNDNAVIEPAMSRLLPQSHAPQVDTESRRSSDCYEEPTNSFVERKRDKNEYERETSIIDGPKRLHLKEIDETDFIKPIRLTYVKALPEDDVAAKGIACIWWFLFLLGRMLTISSFAYFYPKDIFWLLSCHFVLVVALLFYDVRHDEVRRAKAIFFTFIGFVYLFCLIEFKIIFKKPKFIYNGFFILMFVENFGMVLFWWYRNMEDIFNDWWYQYIFYTIISCSTLSFLSMLLYINLLKPKKIIVDRIPYT